MSTALVRGQRRAAARSLACAVVLLVVASGCTARSSYLRQEVPDEELVWAYDNGLELRTGDNQPVAEPPRWDGLRDRVACVPEAAAYAARAEDDGTLGGWLLWSGLGVALGGTGAFIVVGLIGAALTLSAPVLALAVLGAMSVGILAAALGGSALAGFGGHLRRRAVPEALDAVNAYNDAFREEPACRRAFEPESSEPRRSEPRRSEPSTPL